MTLIFRANEEPYWIAPLLGPLLGGLAAALIYTFVIAAHLKEANSDVENVVPNRFNVRAQAQNDYQQQQYIQQHQGMKYAPQPPPMQYRETTPYRGGH